MSKNYPILENLKPLYQMIVQTMNSDNTKPHVINRGDGTEYSFLTTGRNPRTVLTILSSHLDFRSYVAIHSDKGSEIRFTEINDHPFVDQIIIDCKKIIHEREAATARNRINEIVTFLNSFVPANEKKFETKPSRLPEEWHPVYQQIASIVSSNLFNIAFKMGEVTEYNVTTKDTRQEIFSVARSFKDDDNTYLA
ncbi:hypothetical protein HDR63_04165, partial [bacterium]|nr:hypothetical protein [bacterium]